MRKWQHPDSRRESRYQNVDNKYHESACLYEDLRHHGEALFF